MKIVYSTRYGAFCILRDVPNIKRRFQKAGRNRTQDQLRWHTGAALRIGRYVILVCR